MSYGFIDCSIFWWFCIMKLREFFLFLLFEEEIKKIDKYIEKFNKSIIIINNALLTGGTINHNDVELSKVLKEIANNITAEYHKKETAQQNTNIEKEKYKELISIIDKYNKLLNVYNSVRGKNEKTAGDIFRQIGGNTSKKSVKTKTFTKKNK